MARKRAQKGRRPWLLGTFVVVLAGGGAVALSESQANQVAAGTRIGDLELGGKTVDVARIEIEKWWKSNQARQVQLQVDEFDAKNQSVSLQQLGINLDLEKTVAQLPKSGVVSNYVQGLTSARVVESSATYTIDASAASLLTEFVADHRPATKAATARLVGGVVKTTPEVPGYVLDSAQLSAALTECTKTDTLVIPIKTDKIHVSPEKLAEIKTVYSTFTTRFPTYKVSRCANIKRASEIIDGLILLPGEKFSFNERVGRRTEARGFKIAGVYQSGRHDFDVGGGICQVSTTIYNALLLGDLKVSKRSPHSLPVAYVPLGRDAAVSFPNPDLVFENNTHHAMALSARYAPGELTISILGPEKYGRKVTFESKLIDSWSNGEKIQNDPTLKYGQTKLVDAGGSGRRVRTWRIISENGREIKREDMGVSTYSGGPRIVAKNVNAKPPVVIPPVTPGTGSSQAPANQATPGSQGPTRGTSPGAAQPQTPTGQRPSESRPPVGRPNG